MENVQNPARFLGDRTVQQPIENFRDFAPMAQRGPYYGANQRPVIAGKSAKTRMAGSCLEFPIKGPFLVNDIPQDIGRDLSGGKSRLFGSVRFLWAGLSGFFTQATIQGMFLSGAASWRRKASAADRMTGCGAMILPYSFRVSQKRCF